MKYEEKDLIIDDRPVDISGLTEEQMLEVLRGYIDYFTEDEKIAFGLI